MSPLAATATKVAMSRLDDVSVPYEALAQKIEIVKRRLKRPLTLSEKVLYSHIDQPQTQVIKNKLKMFGLFLNVNLNNFIKYALRKY